MSRGNKSNVLYEQFSDPKVTRRNQQLIRTYGIDIHEYRRLQKLQGNKCAICDYRPKPSGQQLHVDHDHKKTGREAIRGLLCWFCNNRLMWVIERRNIQASRIHEYLDNPPAQCKVKKRGA